MSTPPTRPGGETPPATATRRNRRLRILAALCAVAALFILLWTLSLAPDSRHAAAVATTPAPAALALAKSPASSPTAPLPPTASTPAIATDPSAPAHHLRALNFLLEGTSARLVSSNIHPGRVKLPPSSLSVDQLVFTIYDSAGLAIYSGAIDHPIRRHYEVEDEHRPGQLRPISLPSDDGSFLLRLPAELDAARIVITDVALTPVRTTRSRHIVADLPLR